MPGYWRVRGRSCSIEEGKCAMLPEIGRLMNNSRRNEIGRGSSVSVDSKRPPGPYIPSDDDAQADEFRLESSDSSESDN